MNKRIEELTDALQDMVAAFGGGGVTESHRDRIEALNRACKVLDNSYQYANEFLTPDDVRRNPERARLAIEMQADRIMMLKSYLNEAVQALDEAVYLLDPGLEDVQKKNGRYRVVKALYELRYKNA